MLLTIAYDGSTFHGWQKQPGERTVQGYLEQTMSRLFGREILLSGTSRTDAGVHALGQRASFKADIGIPTEKIALVVNNALCAREGKESGRGGFAKSPIRVLEAREMPPEFHARFDSKGKEYIYRIRDGVSSRQDRSADGTSRPEAGKNFADTADMSLVFERNYVYHVGERLDVEAMREAARYYVGEHDFKAFEAAGGNPRETTVRTMFGAEVTASRTGAAGGTGAAGTAGSGEAAGEAGTGAAGEAAGGIIEFHIKGDGFLYNMVRIMTGTLVEVGRGKRRPEDIKSIIESRDRQAAGHTAPPGGLYLAEIYYDR